jgi:hypothetical protein
MVPVVQGSHSWTYRIRDAAASEHSCPREHCRKTGSKLSAEAEAFISQPNSEADVTDGMDARILHTSSICISDQHQPMWIPEFQGLLGCGNILYRYDEVEGCNFDFGSGRHITL